MPHPLPQVDAHGLVVRSAPAPLPEGPSTVSACLETGRNEHPDLTAIMWNDHTLTYSELDSRVEAAAGGLASLGIGPGDRVACSLSNRPALVEAFLATKRLGACLLYASDAADDSLRVDQRVRRIITKNNSKQHKD